MIKATKSISMAEAAKYIDRNSDSGKEIASFVKNFTDLTPKEAEEFREKLENLDLMKLREHHISGIINTMPESNEELNKVVADTSLDENEANKILEIVKEFK